MLTKEAPSAPWIRTGPEVRVCTVEPDCPFPDGGLGSGTSAGGMDTSLRCDGPDPPGPSTRIWNGCVDADFVVTGTTTVVADGVTVAVANAISFATAVTEETPVGTGVPVAASVTAEAMEVSDATGEVDASGVGDASGAAIVAAVVMVAKDVGETVGTDWPDAAGGGIRATKRPATANTGSARRLHMRRRGWTTDVTPSRCPKARSPHRTQ